MNQLEPVIAAIEFDDRARIALEAAHALAADAGCDLRIVHVHTRLVDRVEVAEAYRNLVSEYSSTAVPIVVDIIETLDGIVGEQLVASAAQHRARLVVVADRPGHLGRVTTHLIRHAHCPVLVARARNATGPVVAATDFSDPDLPALTAAGDAARRLASDLAAIHVVEPWQPTSLATAAAVAPIVKYPAEQPVVHAVQRLKRALEELGVPGSVHATTGLPAAEVVRHAVELSAQMIVVGTAGGTSSLRLMLGSVAEEIVREASCSVLVTRTGASSRKEPQHDAVALDPRYAVLAVTDRTAPMDEVIRHGHVQASARNANLIVCHVADASATDSAVSDLARILGDRARGVTGRDDPALETLVERGDPVAVVVSMAHAREVGLIAIDGGDAVGLMGRLFGTLPQHVVRDAPCSVLVIRPRHGLRVLVATDLSEPSLPELREGAREALRRDVPLTVLHCVEPGLTSTNTSSVIEDARDKLVEATRKLMLDTELVVVQGTPSGSIVRTIAGVGADLVVVGGGGRVGLQRRLLGSTAEAVVRDAPCTVLVVRDRNLAQT